MRKPFDKCKFCGKEFNKLHFNQKYCDKKCVIKANHERNNDYFAKYHKKYWPIYYIENKEKILKKTKKYKLENKEKVSIRNKKYDKKRIIKGEHAFSSLLAGCNKPTTKSYQYYGGKGVKCLLSREEFLKIYFRTSICELCSILLNDIDRRKTNGRTIDRIDSNLDYKIENIQIICKSCNSRRIH